MKIIPHPILFNVWKHHADYVVCQLKQAKKLDLAYFAQEVKTIGNNQMDLYVGSLSPEEIGKEIVAILHKKQIQSQAAYQEWITQTQQQFRLITLEDQSVWTLLWSGGTERYIHIHPARHSPHTLRVRGTVLKTVIMSCVYAALEDTQPGISLINQVRKEHLDLSPVQYLNPEEGIGKMLRIFYEMMIGKNYLNSST
jgi:hypothetical protein